LSLVGLASQCRHDSCFGGWQAKRRRSEREAPPRALGFRQQARARGRLGVLDASPLGGKPVQHDECCLLDRGEGQRQRRGAPSRESESKRAAEDDKGSRLATVALQNAQDLVDGKDRSEEISRLYYASCVCPTVPAEE